MKNIVLSFAIISAVCMFSVRAAAGLTTEEILELRECGISEDTIVIMVESGYHDSAKVIRLKQAGFKEENIRAIVKAELKNASGSEEIELQTPARVRIVRYLVFRDSTVLQNDQAMDGAVLSLLRGSKLKVEWKDRGLGLLDALQHQPLKSPFYWDINPKGDALTPGSDGYSYILRSAPDHKGRPRTDTSHYWLLYFDPRDAVIIEHLKKSL